MPSTDSDTLRFADPGISVSEPKAAYGINYKNVDPIELAAVVSHLSASLESSIPDMAKQATPPNTTYNCKNAQAAFNRIEFEGLTHEEVDLLAEYAEFIKSRRRGNL